MTSTQGARKANLGVLAGALFALLWVAGTFAQDFGADSSIAYPRPTDEMSAAQEWFSANGSAAETNAALQIVAAIALIIFAGVVANLIRTVRGSGAAASVASTAGAVSAAMLMVGAAAQAGLATDAASEGPTAQALYQLAFWTGGPLHVATLGLAVVAAAVGLANVLPKWLKITGIVVGSLALLAALSGFGQAFVAFTLFGRYLSFVWLLIVGIAAAFKRAPAGAPAGADAAARV
ncbi:hypothetical protein [Actinophytocola sp. NPDC049390]|uniref:hypothetical protein n=1 Tax=Actinophytocola sp. NPDC049390 TaxID=3363894 RepID=UPI0037A0C9D5